MIVIDRFPGDRPGPSRPDGIPPILRLPPETLGGIFKYVGYNDLLSLSLSCSALHELAAAGLYRHISHVFNVVDSRSTRHSLGHFCAMLETLASSEQNYAAFVRRITLERANMADVGRAEADQSYASGKLLNTLLNIVLRRVTRLESFRWDVRIELNPSIFEALGRIPSLQNLHVRFPAGPLRVSSAMSTSVTPAVAGVPVPSITAPPAPVDVTGVVQPLPQFAQIHGTHHHHHGNSHTQWHETTPTQWANMKPVSSKTIPGRSDFSLVSGLKTLAALDIDDLGCIHELSQCITSSVSSLRSLKLSISDQLATKVRGKVSADMPDSDPVSEGDDWGLNNSHFAQAPAPVFANGTAVAGTSANDPNDPEVYRARIVQEAILAQIFGLDDPTSQQLADQDLEQNILYGDEKAQTVSNQPSKEEEDRDFIQMMRQMVRMLPAAAYSGTASSKSLKTLELIEKSTTKYLERASESNNQAETQPASVFHSCLQHPESSQSDEIPAPPGPSVVTVQAPSISQFAPAAAASNHSAINQGSFEIPSASSAGAHHSADDHLSDIVDMEHPDNIDGTGGDQEFLSGDEGDISGSPAQSTINTAGVETKDAQSGHGSLFNGNSSKEKQTIKSIKPTDTYNGPRSNGKEDHPLKEYIRSTHGVPLDSLSLHLVPMKATLLCRAVDPFVLKHLSLLNVGPQRTLWAMFGELHRIRPLQLTSIHTDNVTNTFLSFVNGLDRIFELFLFECGNRSRVESFAPKTNVKIDDIKVQILDKHISYLQRLVIRNDEDATWALSAHTARHVALNGSNLVELALGLTTSGYHYFVQEIQNLRSLVALQIFYHHPDRCMSMVRELRNCTLDHILHFDYLRIQYLAMCFNINGPVHNYAMHIMRPSHSRPYHSKPKQDSSTSAETGTPFSTPGQSSNESDESWECVHLVIKGIKLREVTGIKMWDKDTWAVRL